MSFSSLYLNYYNPEFCTFKPLAPNSHIVNYKLMKIHEKKKIY